MKNRFTIRLVGVDAEYLPVFKSAAEVAGKARMCTIRTFVANGSHQHFDGTLFSGSVRICQRPARRIEFPAKHYSEALTDIAEKMVQLIDDASGSQYAD